MLFVKILVRDQEARGSNPRTPTTFKRLETEVSSLFCVLCAGKNGAVILPAFHARAKEPAIELLLHILPPLKGRTKGAWTVFCCLRTFFCRRSEDFFDKRKKSICISARSILLCQGCAPPRTRKTISAVMPAPAIPVSEVRRAGSVPM